MKAYLLSLLALLFGITSLAQITVNSTSMATLGDTVWMAEDTVHGYGLDLGEAAGDQHWDFSVLVEHKPDGAILEDPQTAPFSANFPDASFVVNDLYEDSAHIFFRQTSTELEVLGMVDYDSAGNAFLPDFNPPFPFMQFPATLGTTFTSAVYEVAEQIDYLGLDPDSLGPHPFVDSLKTAISMTIHNEIDAWGDLQLPQGTYVTIRQKTIIPVEFHTTCYYNGSWQSLTPLMLMFIDSVTYDTNTENTYRWWTNNTAANFMCAEVREDNGNVDSTVSYIKAVPVPPAGLNENENAVVSVYPNPASDFVTINSDQLHNVVIYDARMAEVFRSSNPNAQTTLSTSSFSTGTYLLLVTDIQGALLRIEKLLVVK